MEFRYRVRRSCEQQVWRKITLKPSRTSGHMSLHPCTIGTVRLELASATFAGAAALGTRGPAGAAATSLT
eukprot:909094-Pelagomonas_calceolata.AAC.2